MLNHEILCGQRHLKKHERKYVVVIMTFYVLEGVSVPVHVCIQVLSSSGNFTILW